MLDDAEFPLLAVLISITYGLAVHRLNVTLAPSSDQEPRMSSPEAGWNTRLAVRYTDEKGVDRALNAKEFGELQNRPEVGGRALPDPDEAN